MFRNKNSAPKEKRPPMTKPFRLVFWLLLALIWGSMLPPILAYNIPVLDWIPYSYRNYWWFWYPIPFAWFCNPILVTVLARVVCLSLSRGYEKNKDALPQIRFPAKTLAVLFCVGVAIFSVHYFRTRTIAYDAQNAKTAAVVAEFRTLVDAWHRVDTNAVRTLCIPTFDPYAKENFLQMDLNMWTQSTAISPMPLLVRHAGERVRFYPDGHRPRRDMPNHVEGRALVYTRENDAWKFTGEIAYTGDPTPYDKAQHNKNGSLVYYGLLLAGTLCVFALTSRLRLKKAEKNSVELNDKFRFVFLRCRFHL